MAIKLTSTGVNLPVQENTGDEFEKLKLAVSENEGTYKQMESSYKQAEANLKKQEQTLSDMRLTIIKAYGAARRSKDSRVKTFASTLLGNYQEKYNGDYAEAYNTYSAAYDALKEAGSRYDSSAKAYNTYIQQKQQEYDTWRSGIRDMDTISGEIATLDEEAAGLEKKIGSLKTLTLFRNDALGQSMKQSLLESQAALEALNKQRESLREELGWSQYFKYADLMDAEDFSKLSQYATTANGKEAKLNPFGTMYSETGFDDLTYDYINRNESAKGKALVNSIGDNSALLGFDKSYLEEMTDDEVAIFNYIYATQGADAAYEYTAYLTGDLTRRQREEQTEKWSEWAEEKPFASSVFSVLMSPAKGLSYLGQAADYVADGTIDQNAAYNKFSYIPSAIREKVPENWGPVGSFAYQTGMSMADFLLTTAVSGGNEAFSLAIMGTGAAADTTIAAKDRGLSDNQAFTLGTVAGLAEIITEKVSLETLLNPDLLKEGTLKYILKNALAEGSEEVGSDLINLVADILVSKDQSEWNQSIQAYMSVGKTKKDAFVQAVIDQVLTMGVDLLGGAISGGIMGTGGALIYNKNTSKTGEALNAMNFSKEDIQLMIENCLESEPGTTVYQVGKELQEKVDSGSELSDKDMGRLYQANVQAAAEESAEQEAESEKSQTTGNVTQDPEGVTQPDSDVPRSVAAQLRQEQTENGGNNYGTETGLRLGAAFERPDAGTDISYGGGQRNDSTGTGKQAGSLAGGTASRWSAERAATAKAITQRQNSGRSLRYVSSQELGVQSGTATRNIKVLPSEMWDDALARTAEQIQADTGKNVTFVLGRIQIRGTNGKVSNVRGVITGDQVIVQADNVRIDAEKIADHEIYHHKSSEIPWLHQRIKEHIVNTYSKEEFDRVLDKYIDGLAGVIDLPQNATGEEFEAAMKAIEEEIFADAYAGINAFGAHAEKWTETVNEKMDELYVGKAKLQDNGVRETNGPPVEETKNTALNSGEKYSGDDYLEMSDEEFQERYGLKLGAAFEQQDTWKGEKYSVSESFAEELQEWFDTTTAEERKTSGKRFLVGTTTDVLKSIGVKDYSIYFGGSKINKILSGNSSMTLDTIKDAVLLLEDPILVMKSLTVDDSIVLFGNVFTAGNKPVMISVLLNPKTKSGEVLDYAVITSAYGRRVGNLQHMIDNSTIYYVNENKNRTEGWLKALGLQLPSAITKLGSIASINDQGGNVKNKADTFEAKQNGASQVLDDNAPSSDVRNVPVPTPKGSIAQKGEGVKERFSVDDSVEEQAEKPKKKTVQPVAESRPLIAKRDLRNTMNNLFSIPSGQRAELGKVIDSFADRLIKNGELTEADRSAFFDRMYEAGVMTVPADEYFAMGRNCVAGGKVYVDDSLRADFGDDFAEFRRRAFAAGVHLTNNRADVGVDAWNVELSGMLPGLFVSEETDNRLILERIVQIAEEGKDEKVSLAEYTARLAEIEHIPEAEFLDSMERQMDWALRTFAEKAKLEVHLRDRTGRKLAQERAARQESVQRARERKELRELQQKTLKQLQWLSKNRNRAPEELRATWDEVLSDIDIYAVGAANEMNWSDKYNASWRDLAQMYKDAAKNDPNFLPSKELERIVARLDGTKIEEMDLGALQDLYKAAVGLRTEFYNRNNVINDEMHRLFAEVYTDAKKEIEAAPGGFTGGKMDKFVNLDQLTPMNVLQRMGGWDPNGAFYSMAKQLEQGERDARAYSVKAQKMLQDFLTEHADFAKKADGQGKDAIWYEVEIPELLALEVGKKPEFGKTVKVWMTPAQKVHLYLESKNQDNLRHMTGGRTFVDKELYSQGKRQEALAQGKTIRMAPETVKAIVSDLTAEEMELARLLDQYYNSFATQEINRVSNILYGYDKAMGKNYAPIYTNRNYTKTEFGVFDTTAEGVGNLKGRQYAVNPSYNISAFDAFERHIDQTARFVGMAIPARNWTTLMNWREKNNSTGDVITHKWGEESKRYITDLITTLQAGEDTKTDTLSSLAGKAQSNYISAVFGANPSIVLKQLGSIPLAGAYLDMRNLPTLGQIKNIDRELIAKYTKELEWRTMGYSTPETKQLKDNPNWTQTNKVFQFAFGGGAITAMDGWAASTLWPWAENKVKREHRELEVGSDAFYQKVAEEFNDAVCRSQSVSDEIHQGALRKSKNPITRAFTLFRSDSAQTYNAIRQKIGEAQYYARTGAKAGVVKSAKKAAGAAFAAMLVNAMWSEGVSFLMALWKNKGKKYRDDDDELTFQSVAGEMVSNMLGSLAGVVTGGEELFELIGNIITGDTWYGIETPGMEQLNDVLDAIMESGSGMRDLVAGGWDVLKNGGNVLEYFRKNSGAILGNIKSLSETAAMYLGGLSASNLEAYLIGTLKWVSPELGAAYDNLFQNVGKSDLAELEGDALESRLGRILDDRGISQSEETAKALTILYEAGYKTAVPGDTPTSVSIDGESQKLSTYQQQAYENIWSSTVADALDSLVSSDSFNTADPELQAKMLSNLYSYAAEQAKAELYKEYEKNKGTENIETSIKSGVELAECIAWSTENNCYDKSYLLEVQNDELVERIGEILENRNLSKSGKTFRTLATLYESGYSNAIPSNIPTSVTVDGEERVLNVSQQKVYADYWEKVVAGTLDEFVMSNTFIQSSAASQAKMLNYLYTYASEMAKASLFEDYDPNTRDESVKAFADAGMTMEDFLYSYGKYSELYSTDTNATAKATAFARWLDDQDYTPAQKAVIKEELSYFNMSPASSQKYDEMVEAGLNPDDAYKLTQEIGELEPLEGEDEVLDVQRWRECVNFSTKQGTQLAALCAVMTEAQFKKVNTAWYFDVSPDAYVGYYEIRENFDANGNGSYSNAEVQAAIDSMAEYNLTKEEKAVLWQLVTGSKSSKNNPYSTSEGQKVLDYLSEK